MPNHLDTVFSPSLYLDRDKQAIAFIEDQLLHQETAAAVCMYGNGKDYLFTNLVKRFEARDLGYRLKVLNTLSADELKDFAEMLESESEPTLCMVNLRIRKDVSWFIRVLEQLRLKRGYAFVSFVSSYAGDVYQALLNTEQPVTHALVVLKRVPYTDAVHIIDELSERFGFYPDELQRQDIYHWSYGHVGLLRTLFLLKRQNPGESFSSTGLLAEPTVLERLNNITRDIPSDVLKRLTRKQLSYIERTFLEDFGYINEDGRLFHALLLPLLSKKPVAAGGGLSVTETRVLEHLRQHVGQVVSREEIASIVWGEEEWEDKYSDWAIGQLIYRLRKKLEYGSSSGRIETRKGQGFVFVA